MSEGVVVVEESAANHDENISEGEMGEEKSSKIYNYDSSYFSKKMAEVDKKGGNNTHMGVHMVES